MADKPCFYVYAYIRRKSSSNGKIGTPYYIGKGKGKRAYNKHDGPMPSDKSYIILLETDLTEVGAFAIERRLIRWWGKTIDGGCLYNKSDGGEGVSGMKTARDKFGNTFSASKNDIRWTTGELTGIHAGVPISKKHKEALVKSHTGKASAKDSVSGIHLGLIPTSDIRWTTGEIIHTNKNIKKPEGFGLKISIARTGIVLSDVTKEKLRKINLGKKYSNVTQEKKKRAMEIKKWINDSKINKRVDIFDLDIFINDGWKLGRIGWAK